MRKLLALLLLLPALAFGQQQIINTGAAPNSGTGDTLQIWATKDNANFTQVFGTLGIGVCGTPPCAITLAASVILAPGIAATKLTPVCTAGQLVAVSDLLATPAYNATVTASSGGGSNYALALCGPANTWHLN